jgi:uncharacterized protein YbjT (DUF2867 family)
MSRVMIVGATGLVGRELLQLLIEDERVEHIAAPTRRPLPESPKVFNPCDPQLE